MLEDIQHAAVDASGDLATLTHGTRVKVYGSSQIQATGSSSKLAHLG